MIFWQIDALLKKHNCDLKTPIKDIPKEAMDGGFVWFFGEVEDC